MISRRKFVGLLAAVPLVGKAWLASTLKPAIPRGYVQCDVCGEFNGSTDAKNLSWRGGRPPSGKISVTCLCHGIPCKRCGRLMHRPISNTYYPGANEVGHWPYFVGCFPCAECRAKERDAKKQ